MLVRYSTYIYIHIHIIYIYTHIYTLYTYFCGIDSSRRTSWPKSGAPFHENMTWIPGSRRGFQGSWSNFSHVNTTQTLCLKHLFSLLHSIHELAFGAISHLNIPEPSAVAVKPPSHACEPSSAMLWWRVAACWNGQLWENPWGRKCQNWNWPSNQAGGALEAAQIGDERWLGWLTLRLRNHAQWYPLDTDWIPRGGKKMRKDSM